MAQTYSLQELSKLLNFTAPYIKMLLKRMGHDPDAPIDEALAKQLAEKLSRPWPPAADAEG